MRNKSRVFFLGAGASVEAGVPMAAQLVTLIRSHDAYKLPGKWFTAHSQLEFLQVTIEGILANENWRQSGGLQTPNIEQLLGIGLTAAQFGIRVPHSEGKVADAKWFTDVLTWWTLEAIELSQSRDLPEQYAAFCGLLTDSDSIITLNYDLVCERYLRARGLIPNYYLEAQGVPPATVTGVGLFDLLKPHGSLNWRKCVSDSNHESCGKTFIYGPDHSLPAYGYELSRVCTCGRGSLLCPIAPPTAPKHMSHPELEMLWRVSMSKLLAADEIYIIGYSMPSYDTNVENLLRLTAIRNQKAIVHLVNPSAGIEERFAFIPPKRFVHQPRQTFKEFVQTIK